MLTMISRTFISQDFSFSFSLGWCRGWGRGNIWVAYPPLTHTVGKKFHFFPVSFRASRDAWNMRLWSNVRGFCATIWSSRMSSTAASNRRLEGKVAIVTASTDGWVTQYFFSSFELQIELIKSIIESQAQKFCSHICKKRKLKSKEEFVQTSRN